MPPPVTHVDIERSESHDAEPEPEGDHMDGHFVSAPVSRGEASHSIDPDLLPSQVRLTPEQREPARLSMPHLSHDEAEKSYAANFLKMQKMKKAKLISE